jgi:fructose-1,6-bisphosphatase/sedoheptulose 1,7-bisphosphatase-like protein
LKSQEHNKGELKELKVKVEKDVVDAFETMAKNTGTPVDDLVVIALKRFRVSHSDYEGAKYSAE